MDKKKVPLPDNNQTLNIQNKEGILKTAKEKGKVTYKADLSELHLTSQWRQWKSEGTGQELFRY